MALREQRRKRDFAARPSPFHRLRSVRSIVSHFSLDTKHTILSSIRLAMRAASMAAYDVCVRVCVRARALVAVCVIINSFQLFVAVS